MTAGLLLGAVPAWADDGGDLAGRYIATEWAVRNADVPVAIFIPQCTLFVSNALWQAGLPETDEWSGYSSNRDYVAAKALGSGPTKAAANADYFKNYIVDHGLGSVQEVSWGDNTAGGAELGDVIGYDWQDQDGNSRPDGVLDHLALVTSLSEQGYPSVTQREPTRVNRFWSWDPGSNDWIENSHASADGQFHPRVYLIHIDY